MRSSDSLSNQRWDAYRYLLEDPTLDRAMFEQRMLEDPELALETAQAVEDLGLMQSAMSTAPSAPQLPTTHVAPATAPTSSHSGLLWLAALAAVVLLAALPWGAQLLTQRLGWDTPEQLAQTRSAADVSSGDVAEQWIQLVSHAPTSDEALSTASYTADASAIEAMHWDEAMLQTTSSALDHEEASSDSSDWLLEAASQFYSEGAAG